ncbi:TetR/AcrR family transcriptional regulator [Streptomyces pseudogriseolus]|uniref:TetR/AcrR family transcriptional regulator n=1 Tax=Streptomyces pseudogriseolus TaxID=36817 RepID=UPI003FA26DEE
MRRITFITKVDDRTPSTAGAAVRRPHRADARRNFDKLLAAARTAFAEQGSGAPLEDIACTAGVGIGTLHRKSPTRQALFDAVYRLRQRRAARPGPPLHPGRHPDRQGLSISGFHRGDAAVNLY